MIQVKSQGRDELRAVFFDLDGTLLNRDQSVLHFIKDQYSRLKPSIEASMDRYVKRFVELDNHGSVWKDQVYDTLVKEFNIQNISAEELLQDYLSYFPNHCVPFQHLEQMLQVLKEKQIKLGIISNGFGKFQMDNMKALKIESYFQCILISENEGLRKPDKEIFLRGLSLLEVPAHKCIFIGDHPINDIEAASKVGMKTIWKKNNLFSQTPKADYVIEDLLEIVEILEKEEDSFIL